MSTTPLGKRSDHERLAELIRTGAIAWHRSTNPNWRDKPHQDGIQMDLDEDEQCAYLARYLMWKLPMIIGPEPLAQYAEGGYVPPGPTQTVNDLGEDEQVWPA